MKFNDRMRYEFNGKPERCLQCGTRLRHSTVGKQVQYWCPQGREDEGHERYRWNVGDPGLPLSMAPFTVGDMGPGERRVFVTSVYFAILFLATVLLATFLVGLGAK